MVEVLHVVPARRLEVEQYRRLASHAVQRVEIDVEAHAARDRRQVHDAVGRAADGEQHAHRVLERGGREDPVDGELVARHLHRLRAGLLGDPDAIGGDGRRRRAAGHRHAQRLGDARHRAGRAHHRAGAHARHQLVVDVAPISSASMSPARYLRPVAPAIGARAHALAAVRAGQHRARDELDGGDAGRRRAHQLRRHGLVAAADQHDGVHRLRADHLLGVDRHEVAQEHARRRARSSRGSRSSGTPSAGRRRASRRA